MMLMFVGFFTGFFFFLRFPLLITLAGVPAELFFLSICYCLS